MRFLPAQDEYGRWAVQDTLWTDPWMMVPRYVDERSAQGFCDIMNATGSTGRQMDALWAAHREVRRFAPMLERSES